ncbi:DUF4936 family protein [Vogesella oryzae]|uniref:DUF4936 family protein n=1 Tax=Vogesella oryzae TaxID=1735285 RepID=UPI0015842C9A|nr:DUF4936 family protein [Vogesella oryzae]
MPASLYVYYRVSDNFLPTKQLISELTAEIIEKTGIQGRLLQRRDDAHTWMEIYEAISDVDGFSLALHDAISARPTLAALQRHEEWFVALA